MHARPKISSPRTSARLLFVGIALAVAALGGWIFHGDNEPRIAGVRTAPTDTLSTAPNSALDPREQVEKHMEDVGGDPLMIASHDDLLSLLRGKWDASGSAEDVLAALAEIARDRPALAIELAQALGRSEEEKTLWVTDFTRQWSERDPQSAWEWLTQLPVDRMDQLANGSLPGVVLDGMAAREPQRLTGLMDALVRTDRVPGSIAPAVAMHLGLQALIKSGEVTLAQTVVEAWARDPLKPDVGRSAYETVALALGKNNSVEAGNWLTSLPLSEERNAAIATFASDWGDRDPAAALQWVGTLAPQEGQHVALERTFTAWAERDAIGAAEWLGDYLSQLPTGTKSDRLIGSLIAFSPTLRSAPEVARQWTELISDPERRASYEEQVAWRWSRHDLAAATHYVQNSSSMAWQQKQALLQKMQSLPAASDLDE